MLATTLADRRKVGLGKSVVPDERIVSVWESKQAGALGWRHHAATWQDSENWQQFILKLNRYAPRFNETITLDLNESDR